VPGASLDRMITSGVAKSGSAKPILAKPIVAKPTTAQASIAKPRPRDLAAQSGANP
jgi:hypothetical protein